MRKQGQGDFLIKPRSVVRNEQGLALLSALILMILLLTLGMTSLVYSTLDLKSTTHYRTGNQAFFAAEAGLVHALSNINQVGVLDFNEDIVRRWDQVFGAAIKVMPQHPNIQYEVAVVADAGDPLNAGSLTAVGLAPLEARRVLRVGLRKGGFGGLPGAIYVAADEIESDFAGNAFEVDGNDHDVFGDLTGGAVKPGIATRNDSATDSVVDSLSDGQKDNVQGLGFSLDPLTPSVLTTGGPDVNDLDRMVAVILASPGTVRLDGRNFNGNDVFGTLDVPQITYMTNPDVRLNGRATGVGILVVDGSITINGGLDFVGWIIVRGDTIVNVTGSGDDDTIVLGNATILGSLWTGNLAIQVGGSAIVDYCDACVRLADGVGSPEHLVPRPMRITFWQEVL